MRVRLLHGERTERSFAAPHNAVWEGRHMRYSIFLVEDDIVAREGIRDLIDWASAGFEFCGEAPDGETALPLIQERRPEVVITDLKMPFMDGFQLCRALKASLPDTRLIILSGNDTFASTEEARAIGVTEYMLKPLAIQEFLVLLRRLARQLDEARQQGAAEAAAPRWQRAVGAPSSTCS